MKMPMMLSPTWLRKDSLQGKVTCPNARNRRIHIVLGVVSSVEPLYHTPETNTLYANYLEFKLKLYKKEKSELCVMGHNQTVIELFFFINV